MAVHARAFQDGLLGFPPCGNPQGLFAENVAINGGNGCWLNLNIQQQLLQKQVQLQQRNQSLPLEGAQSNGVVDRRFSPSASSQPLILQVHAQIDRQWEEVDAYLHLQNERLRLVVQECRKRQMAELLRVIESKTQMLMNQKDQEIALAAQKTAELQELLARLEVDNEAWRRLAEENQAMVVSLNNTLEELRVDRVCSTSTPSESYFVVNGVATACRPELEEGSGENGVMVETATAVGYCRGCGSREATVLILPCRHLCSCGPCAAVLDFCPVCNAEKKACVEALIT
ncbi:hypothetical protein SAY87_007313 [Trapa incisa]|uniref:RING-type domain-containing protein n=1 Tax=Trapa incisa TaxID=236973 RepID=A0AAN7Q0A7_9MYRT|nr:hypothetical protein SAY87_007313 [Trapa incisa]